MAKTPARRPFEKTLDARPNDQSIIKPGELVDIVEMTPLTLSDRRVYNLLIANAWEHIGEPLQHAIPRADLQRTLHKGTDRLEDSIRRLMAAIVEVRVADDRKWATRRVQLLGGNVVPDAGDGLVRYDFQPLMRQIIGESRVFARLHKQIMFALSSKYSLALYEIVQKRGNMSKNYEDLPLTDLRNFMGVPQGRLASWINLKNKAITPAVKEVSDLSEFLVTIAPIKGKGRGFSHVRLSWSRKPTSALRPPEREPGSGEIEVEAPPPPSPAADLASTNSVLTSSAPANLAPANLAPASLAPASLALKPGAIEKAKALCPGYDVARLEGEWRAWAAGKPAPAHPDAAFVAFCKAYARRHPL